MKRTNDSIFNHKVNKHQLEERRLATQKSLKNVNPNYLRERHTTAHLNLPDSFYEELAEWRLRYHEEGERIIEALSQEDDEE